MSGTIAHLSEYGRNQSVNVIVADTSTSTELMMDESKKDLIGKTKHKNHHQEESAPVKEGLTTVAHCCVFAFVFLIVYLCFKEPFDFFTWHPLLLSIGVSTYLFFDQLFIYSNEISAKISLVRA